MEREIGEGQFGRVCIGSARIGGGMQKVAIKYLTKEDDKSRLQFTGEALRMQPLSHDNVVKMLAVCFDSSPYFILMELMVNGDLKTYLRLWKHCQGPGLVPPLTAGMQLRLAVDVAAGLSYLAGQRITHRDVAARNVLVSDTFTAKLADFGTKGLDCVVVQFALSFGCITGLSRNLTAEVSPL